MKRPALVVHTSVVVLSLILSFTVYSLALAGRPNGQGKTSTGQVTVSPGSVTSPVSSSAPLTVCASGFGQGNFVNVNVPMAGSPDLHSSIGYSFYVDATGGFCFTTPPAWTNLNLSAGTYTITTFWARDGLSSHFNTGPTGTFTILAN